MELQELLIDEDYSISAIAESIYIIDESLKDGVLTKEQAAELIEDVKQLYEVEQLAQRLDTKQKVQFLLNLITNIIGEK